MTSGCHKILIVEPDPETLEILVASLKRRFDAHLTCVADASSCLDAEMLDPHDLVIAELDMEEGSGLELTESLMALSSRPVVLLAHDPSFDDAVEAMRLGARDIFSKPFAVSQLIEAVDGLLRDQKLQRQYAAKYHRMRKLVRRVIRERRDLRRRIELVCRDLVGAQRRLVHRVLSLDETKPNPTT